MKNLSLKSSLVVLSVTVGLLSGCAGTQEKTATDKTSVVSTRTVANEMAVSTPRELTRAISRLRKGGTIIMEAGDYADLNLSLARNYKAEKPLVIRARTGGTVFITGNTAIEINGENITLSGLTFERGTRTGGQAELIYMAGENNRITQSRFNNVDDLPGVWVQMNGQNNRIDHSWFEGKASGSSYINMDVGESQPLYHRVDNNYFTRQPLGKNGGSIFRVGHGSMYLNNARVTFEYNLFDDASGESEVISSKSGENIFRYNTFNNSRGQLSLRQGNRSLVYDNYFIGAGENKHGGLFVRGEGHLIFNNYFYNLRSKPKSGEAGGVLFGAATTGFDGQRAARGLNGRHFPLTRNILFTGNTLVKPGDYGIVVGSQYGTRNRTTVPDNLYILNNQLADAAKQTVLQLDGAKDMVWQGNYTNDPQTGLKDEGVATETFTLANTLSGLPMPAERQPGVGSDTIKTYLDRLQLDMDWEENRTISKRVIEQSAKAGFTQPVNPEDQPVKPLTKKDVGPDWMKS